MSEKLLGRVQWFSREHGYGMVKGEEGTQFFLHYSEFLQRADGKRVNLWEGQLLQFVGMRNHPKGPRAIQVEIIE